jgi:septum formation protein
MIGIKDFKVIPDTSDEEITPGLSPEQQVCKLALQKAENVSLLCGEDDVIIAADTLVYLDGEPLGKPESRSDAEVMLGKLSGRKHSVYTGVTLLRNGAHVTCTEKTDVFFREISADEISAYAETDEPMDKAGSYAAQGRGAVFVERIEGDFFNVMGLPLCRLSILLRDLEVVV